MCSLTEPVKTAKAALENAVTEHLQDEEKVSVELRPGLSLTEIAKLEQHLGNPLPPEIHAHKWNVNNG